MRASTLFELFLAVFTFYAIFNYEGSLKVIIPILCLFTAFLCERWRRSNDEAEEAEQRLRKYQREEYQRKRDEIGIKTS